MTAAPLTLLKQPDLMERLGVKRTKLYQLRKDDPDFPEPVSFGRVQLWRADEVDAYISNIFAQRSGAAP